MGTTHNAVEVTSGRMRKVVNATSPSDKGKPAVGKYMLRWKFLSLWLVERCNTLNLPSTFSEVSASQILDSRLGSRGAVTPAVGTEVRELNGAKWWCRVPGFPDFHKQAFFRHEPRRPVA